MEGRSEAAVVIKHAESLGDLAGDLKKMPKAQEIVGALLEMPTARRFQEVLSKTKVLRDLRQTPAPHEFPRNAKDSEEF